MTENPRESLNDIEQRDNTPTELAVAPVPVRLDGPATVQQLPARMAPVTDFVVTAAWTMVVGHDLKRRRIQLLGDADFLVSHGPFGGARWPANVPLVLEHGDAVYAKQSAGACTLTVIPENWAD